MDGPVFPFNSVDADVDVAPFLSLGKESELKKIFDFTNFTPSKSSVREYGTECVREFKGTTEVIKQKYFAKNKLF